MVPLATYIQANSAERKGSNATHTHARTHHTIEGTQATHRHQQSTKIERERSKERRGSTRQTTWFTPGLTRLAPALLHTHNCMNTHATVYHQISWVGFSQQAVSYSHARSHTHTHTNKQINSTPINDCITNLIGSLGFLISLSANHNASEEEGLGPAKGPIRYQQHCVEAERDKAAASSRSTDHGLSWRRLRRAEFEVKMSRRQWKWTENNVATHVSLTLRCY